jgi:hypothetical protein
MWKVWPYTIVGNVFREYLVYCTILRKSKCCSSYKRLNCSSLHKSPYFVRNFPHDLWHSKPYQEGAPYLPPLYALDTSVGVSPVSSCVIQNVWIIFRFRSAHVEVLSYFMFPTIVGNVFREYLVYCTILRKSKCCSSYKRLNCSSLHKSPYFVSGSQKTIIELVPLTRLSHPNYNVYVVCIIELVPLTWLSHPSKL